MQRIPLSAFKPQTRSGGEVETSDAIYVVNFDNDEGFAILSADDRLPDDVIAVSSSGHVVITPGPVTDYDNPEDSLTLEDLYVPEDDDYLLGSNAPDRFLGGLVTNYVIGWTDSLRSDADTGLIPELPLVPINPSISYTYEYETVEHVPEMLTTTWHQWAPFNTYCDKRYYYYNWLGKEKSQDKPYGFDAVGKWGDDFIRSEDLPAGCVAIAVAQILAYNRYPSMDEVINEVGAMPWDSLVMNESSLDSMGKIRQPHYRAKMVHGIGVGCDMKYGFWGTEQSFATPAAAKRYLEDIGYSNVKKYNHYDLEVIRKQLQKDCPVFIGALGRIGSKSGHAWIIDGYRQVDYMKIGKDDNGIVQSRSIESSSYYVHFNWGWSGGYSDGWYSTNLMSDQTFNSRDADVFDDDNKVTSEEFEYTWWFRLVTYDKLVVESNG